jgi:hypothetical protein
MPTYMQNVRGYLTRKSAEGMPPLIYQVALKFIERLTSNPTYHCVPGPSAHYEAGQLVLIWSVKKQDLYLRVTIIGHEIWEWMFKGQEGRLVFGDSEDDDFFEYFDLFVTQFQTSPTGHSNVTS